MEKERCGCEGNNEMKRKTRRAGGERGEKRREETYGIKEGVSVNKEVGRCECESNEEEEEREKKKKAIEVRSKE